MAAPVDAAARGDAVEAFRHLERTLQVEGARQPYQLRELVVLGDDAPGWMYSRWCVDQAYRWMLLEGDPRVEIVVRWLLVTVRAERARDAVDDPGPVPRARYLDRRRRLALPGAGRLRVWWAGGLPRPLTTYDACYVALAELLDEPLATTDLSLTRAPGPRCAFITP